MKKYEKNYIGKGTKVENMEIVKVAICMDDAQKHTFEYNGKTYLKFEVAALMEPDNYGKTHTAYVSKLVDVIEEADMVTLPQEEPKKPAKTNGKKK